MLAALVFVIGVIGANAQSTSPIYPTNGSVCIPYNLTLQWQPMLNAVSYDVVVAKSSDFDASTVVVDTTGVLTNFLPVALEPNKFYYWKVTTVYPDVSITSGTFGFHTKELTPTLVSPANGATCLGLAVRLDWNATPGAGGYSVQVAETQDFANPLFIRSGITRLYDTIPLSKRGATYYWRVRANVGGCETDWSVPNGFTTKQAAPALISPADSAQSVTIFSDANFSGRFVWDSLPTATLYNIQFATNPAFTNPTSVDLTDSFRVQTFPFASNQRYFWRVRALFNNGCWSDFGAARTFKTPYDSTRLVYPDNNAQCLPTQSLLRWNKIPAFKYRVQVARDANFTPGSMTYNAIVSDTTYLTDFQEGSLTYFWRVRAEDSLNAGFWSAPRTFVTTYNAPVTPTDNLTSIPLNYQLTWNEINASALYSVQVSRHSNFDTLLVNTTGIAVPNLNIVLPEYNHTYYWRVKQLIGACESGWSLPTAISTQLQPVTGLLPADSATKVSVRPTFKWNKTPEAIGYDIVVALDPQFKTVVRFENDVKTNMVIFPEFDELTTYFWRVRATAGTGKEGAWSKTQRFTTGLRDFGEITLVSPANESSKIPAGLVYLKWNEAPTATSYHVQLAADNAFSNLLIDSVIIVNNPQTEMDSLRVTNLTPGADYYWRVQASNQYHTSEWSSTFTFRTAPLPPTVKATLLSPENGAQDQPINVLLTWQEVPQAEGYELQVATSSSFQEGTFAFNSTHVWSAFKFITLLDTNKTYYWRVRGWNDGGSAPWSDVFTFSTGVKTSARDAEAEFHAFISPNPANLAASLQFELPAGGAVKVEIYDARGLRAATVYDGAMSAGKATLPLDLKGLPSGAYRIAIVSGGARQTVPLVIRK